MAAWGRMAVILLVAGCDKNQADEPAFGACVVREGTVEVCYQDLEEITCGARYEPAKKCADIGFTVQWSPRQYRRP